MTSNTEFALADTLSPPDAQTEEQKRQKLAALEAHDADVPTSDHNASQPLKAIPAPAGADGTTSEREGVGSESLSSQVANSDPNAPTLNDAPRSLIHEDKSSQPQLTPSTLAQWMPTLDHGTPSSDGVERPSHPPPTSTSTMSPEVQSSNTPDKKSFPSTTLQEKETAMDVDTSPASSDLEKEVDLESGRRHSSSSGNSGKAEVFTEQPLPDSNVVDWEGPDDPQNPMNWKESKKWGNIAIIASITFLTPLASSMFAPGVPQVMSEFHSDNDELASFVVSIYVLGYAMGPMAVAPLSELYGRLPVYHVCNVLFVVFTIACAVSSNLGMLIVLRLLEGLFGSCPLTIGGGTIADMIPQQKRGGVMAIWALGPLMGPVIGPVAGGYLSQAKGWRWVFWVIAMAGGAISISAFIFMGETYAPVLLERKAKKLRKQTGNENLRSKLKSPLTSRALFKLSIIRPFRMLVFSPVVLILSAYVAIVYGYLYLLFTTITEVYESNYHFSQGSVGLTFLGIGIGSLIGVVVFGFASDRIVKAKSKNGEMKPEYRLPPMIPGCFCVPVGLFLYGWTSDKHVFWLVPIIGTGLVGIGLLATFMPIQTYLVDAFTVYAASAIAANTILRSLLGALLPLAGRSMYATLGLGWGNSLLAFIALALCPIPYIFYTYGERIRKSPRFQRDW